MMSPSGVPPVLSALAWDQYRPPSGGHVPDLPCSSAAADERYKKPTPPFAQGAWKRGPSIPFDGSRPIPLRCPRENIRKTKSNRATRGRSEIFRSRHTPADGRFRRAEKYASAIEKAPRLH